jgi:uncharacterized protein (TIGR03663 family)
MSNEQLTMGEEKPTRWLDKTPIPALPWLTMEVLIFAGVILLALVSRFYNLGLRVMSHDESLHTYYSYLFSQGQGYQHNPMMHGPLQFHLIALTYFIFGASDFTARVPAAIFSILTVAAAWQWRRYLGRSGALIVAIMALISPFLLYYGRYTREDPYVGVSLFIMLYSILRYLETGKTKFIYLITGALLLHFLTKETAFIYAAMTLIYLAVYFIIRILRKPWENNDVDYRGFIISMIATVVLIGAALAVAKLGTTAGALDAGQTASPAVPTDAAPLTPEAPGPSPFVYVLGALGVVGLAGMIFFVFRGYGWEKIRQERSFDLLIVVGTMVLPMLSAFAMKFLTTYTQKLWNISIAIPIGDNDISSMDIKSIILMIIVLAVFVGAAIWVGMAWNKDVWWKAALLFFAIYTVFYTSFFTNGAGFLTGVIGSLGYWLEQQGVARGSQPWYYYTLITIPIYEFLPAIACLLALYLSLRRPKLPADATPEMIQADENRTNMVSLLGWWSFGSILAFTIAGEKMPWLTFHMALPMVLWGGWAIGQVIDNIDWADLSKRKPLLVFALLVVFVIGICVVFISLLGNPGPFAGKELPQLQVTATFIVSLVGVAASAWGLYVLLAGWSFRQMASMALLIFFGILGILTVRASIRANYVLYDSGMEQLVYAHGYTGIKDALAQISDLSDKTTGDPYAIVVAYDDAVSWPLSWYMRDFKNSKFYGGSPGADLKEVPAILVGASNYTKIEPLVGDKFYKFEYIRMVWPNQDYFNLVSERPDAQADFDETYPCTGVLGVLKLIKKYDYSKICNAITNPQMREAIFNIWLNRDYTKYAEVTGSTGTTNQNWDPSDHMRLYIKKDVAQTVWKYGAPPVAPKPDPWEKGAITLTADLVVGGAGSDIQLNSPRGMAVAPDGTLYVADSRNHRIVHFSADGKLINTWGNFADGNTDVTKAPGGTFNEPWGVAVGPDGSVYVSDTWNGRVQKFDATGKFIKQWGSFGQADATNTSPLYGPRGISVDINGHVYLADTGNKRIMVFDSEGKVLTQIGSEGFAVGQFSEPVDAKVDAQGNVYVTDTWNQRVQVFSPSPDGKTFTPLRQWPIENGWKSQSLDNKPYIAVAPNGHVFITDPEGYRVIEFNSDGTFLQWWGAYGTDNSSFGLASGIAVDAKGMVWVTDSANNRVMRFTVPEKSAPAQ